MPEKTSGQTTLASAPGEWDRQVFQKAMDILSDPRNAWLGFGPLAGVKWTPKAAINAYEQLSKRGLWHDWLNRRYDYPVFDRPIEPSRLSHSGEYYNDLRINQRNAIQGHYLANALNNLEEAREIGVPAHRLESFTRPHWNAHKPRFEGTAAGKAAYDAVSRQVGRMLDESLTGQYKLNFGSSTPEPVPWGEYRRALPRLATDVESGITIPIPFSSDERALWDSLGFQMREQREGIASRLVPMRRVELPSGQGTTEVWMPIRRHDPYIDEPME